MDKRLQDILDAYYYSAVNDSDVDVVSKAMEIYHNKTLSIRQKITLIKALLP